MVGMECVRAMRPQFHRVHELAAVRRSTRGHGEVGHRALREPVASKPHPRPPLGRFARERREGTRRWTPCDACGAGFGSIDCVHGFDESESFRSSPLQNSTAHRAIAPRAVAFHVPTPPASMFAVMAATETALAPAAAAPIATAPAPEAAPAPPPAVTRTPSSTGSASAWSAEGPAATSLRAVRATQAGRSAERFLRVRRAQLARIVKGVVDGQRRWCA